MDKREKKSIAAIILAAGYSSRMGDFKPLLKLGTYTAIEHTIHCFFKAGINDVRVVLGHKAEEITKVVEPYDIKTVYNPFYDQGMYTSVQSGVAGLDNNTDAFLLLPADHPMVCSNTIRKLTTCYENNEKGIIYPVYKSKRGHPPLISTKYAYEILEVNAQPNGLKGLLEKYEHDAIDVEVSDEAILLDMDNKEDYRNLQDYYYSRRVPDWEECNRLLRKSPDGPRVWKHCHLVAGFAFALASRLNKMSLELDEDLVLAGALLHDLVRSQPEHAAAGKWLLETKGYPRVADIVAVHMDIEVKEDKPLSEAEIVYLADKMATEEGIVPISERLAKMLARFNGNSDACSTVRKRMKQAELIKMKLEKKLGQPIETIYPFDLQVKKEDETQKCLPCTAWRNS